MQPASASLSAATGEHLPPLPSPPQPLALHPVCVCPRDAGGGGADASEAAWPAKATLQQRRGCRCAPIPTSECWSWHGLGCFCLRTRLSDLSLRASGADGAEHDHSLDLNAAVAAVEAPPAQPSGEPSGEAGPSGLLPPRVLAGSPSDIADELGCEFRRGQRVVRALLDETGSQTAMPGRDGLLLPPMPPTPGPTPGLLGSTRGMRHPAGGRDECGRLRPPGSDGSMRSDSSSPPSGPRSLPAAPPPAPGAGKLAVRRGAPAVDISMLTSGLRGVSLGKRTLDQRA